MLTYFAIIIWYLFFGIVAASVLRAVFSDRLYSFPDTWFIVLFFIATLALTTIGILCLGNPEVFYGIR